jgi:anthranilate phosphoribosyltransferase
MFEITPESVGLKRVKQDALRGGDAKANAEALLAVLNRKDGAYRDVAVMNAGAALVIAGVANDLKEGVALAQASIESGKAKARLEKLIKVSAG